MTEEIFSDSAQSATIAETERPQRRSFVARIAGHVARNGAEIGEYESADPIYDMYGDEPDLLYATWKKYDSGWTDAIEDDQLTELFDTFITSHNSALGRRKGTAKLSVTDFEDLVELHREMGRVDATIKSIKGSHKDGGFVISQSAEFDGLNKVSEMLRYTFKTAEEAKTLEVITKGITSFPDSDDANHKEAAKALGDALSEVQEASKADFLQVSKHAVNVLKLTDKAFELGPEGAQWVIDVVLGTKSGHVIAGKQAIAEQLIAEYQHRHDGSRLQRAIDYITTSAKRGSLIEQFTADLLDDEKGSSIHKFYSSVMKLDPKELSLLFRDNFDKLPESTLQEYDSYAANKLSRITLSITSIARNTRTNRGPVFISDVTTQASRLFKRFQGSKPSVIGVRNSKGKVKLDGGSRRTMTDRQRVFHETTIAVDRELKCAKRSLGSEFIVNEDDPRKFIESAMTKARRRPETTVALISILEDLGASKLFKRGVQQLGSVKGIRLQESGASARSLYSVNPGRYPDVSGSRELYDCRLTFVMGDKGEIVLVGAYGSHRDYEQAIANLQ